ncbi:MAG: hypothetical protein AABZ10_06990 [Nitrospirota bacterium]
MGRLHEQEIGNWTQFYQKTHEFAPAFLSFSEDASFPSHGTKRAKIFMTTPPIGDILITVR